MASVPISDGHLTMAHFQKKIFIVKNFSSSFPFSASMIHQLPSLFDGRDNFMKPGLHDHAPTTITLTAAFTLPHESCVHAPRAMAKHNTHPRQNSLSFSRRVT